MCKLLPCLKDSTPCVQTGVGRKAATKCRPVSFPVQDAVCPGITLGRLSRPSPCHIDLADAFLCFLFACLGTGSWKVIVFFFPRHVSLPSCPTRWILLWRLKKQYVKALDVIVFCLSLLWPTLCKDDSYKKVQLSFNATLLMVTIPVKN